MALTSWLAASRAQCGKPDDEAHKGVLKMYRIITKGEQEDVSDVLDSFATLLQRVAGLTEHVTTVGFFQDADGAMSAEGRRARDRMLQNTKRLAHVETTPNGGVTFVDGSLRHTIENDVKWIQDASGRTRREHFRLKRTRHPATHAIIKKHPDDPSACLTWSSHRTHDLTFLDGVVSVSEFESTRNVVLFRVDRYTDDGRRVRVGRLGDAAPRYISGARGGRLGEPNARRTASSFRLWGVVVHDGGATGGHYKTYLRTRSAPGRDWTCCNDASVKVALTESQFAALEDASPVVLLYATHETFPPPPIGIRNETGNSCFATAALQLLRYIAFWEYDASNYSKVL